MLSEEEELDALSVEDDDDAPAVTNLTPAAPEAPKSLYQTRLDTLANLARAIDAATDRLARAARGESVFSTPQDVRTALALAKSLPHVLPHLPQKPPPPPPNPELKRFPPDLPLIPICPKCLLGRGAHWVERCPELTPQDDLDDLKALQAYAKVRWGPGEKRPRPGY